MCAVTGFSKRVPPGMVSAFHSSKGKSPSFPEIKVKDMEQLFFLLFAFKTEGVRFM